MLNQIIDVIGNTGSWILDKLNEAFFGFLNQILESVLGFTFEMLNTFLLELNDLGAFFDYGRYLDMSIILAGGLLTVAVSFEVLKQISGNIYSSEQKSISTLTGQIVFAGALIFILPWSVDNIFMKINNLLVQAIGATDFDVGMYTIDSLLQIFDFANYGLIILGFITVMVIGFTIIGLVAAKRYIELIIAILIAPIVAVSFVRSKEAIKVWVLEVTALTFTQVIHVLLLHLLISIMAADSNIMKPLLVIAVLMVMISGPKVLKQYLYSTGAVQAGASTVGTLAQVAMIR